MATTLLFIGDIVGETGLAYLEAHLPAFSDALCPDFIVANAENIALTAHPRSPGNCGMTPDLLDRLFALGVDLVTGGNHSWDGPFGRTIHDNERVLRPLNYGDHAPGRGAAIICKDGQRLGVINLMSRTAMREADWPLAVFERQMQVWEGQVDMILVDFHGESVTEKVTFGYACAGRVAAVLGTHTHVGTLDTRLLPGDTAYVTDVGMTGPSGGIQGYAPELFINSMRLRLPSDDPFALATGPVELGAVVVRCEGGRATAIERLNATSQNG
jgi:metallophosphoesterase (TIGR00282 family)